MGAETQAADNTSIDVWALKPSGDVVVLWRRARRLCAMGLIGLEEGERSRGLTLMYAVRIHGRGGQGVVTAAELLSLAAFADGKHALAFPSFGSERMGAPVMAFCRIDSKTIRTREAVTHPDVLIIQDPTLLHQVQLFSGLSTDGYVLVNSTLSLDELGIGEFLESLPIGHVCVVPASDIGVKHMRRPIANTPLLGAFAALTGVIALESVQSAMRQKFSGALGEANAAAAKDGYDQVISSMARTRSGVHHARAT